MKIHKLTAIALAAAFSANAQICETLTERTTNLKEIGRIKGVNSEESRANRLGVGFECLDRKVFDPEKVYDKIAKSGLKFARCQTGWARTETQKGKYDFAWLDSVVDNLRARGIQPWFNVGYGNPLYMDNLTNPTGVGHVPLYYGEECLQAWKNYVRALARHFKGRVDQFEIWNESNHLSFWQPEKPDAKEYAKLLKISADEIRKEIPAAKIGAAMAGSPPAYFRELFAAGAGEILDFVSIHPYDNVPEIAYDQRVRGALSILREFGAGHVKLRQGEAGFPFRIPADCWKKSWHPSDEDIQAKWMLRRFVIDLHNGLDMSSIFMVCDFNPNYKVGGKKQPVEAQWGLIENAPNYRPRKAVEVASRICALLDDKTEPAECAFRLGPQIPEGVRVSRLADVALNAATKCFARNGYPMVAYYMPEDLQFKSRVIENVPATFVWGKAAIENPVIVDPFDGRIYAVTSKFYGGGAGALPVADYPLMLTDRAAIADIAEFLE